MDDFSAFAVVGVIMFDIDIAGLMFNAGAGVRFLLTGSVVAISLWLAFHLARFLLTMMRLRK